MPAPDPAIQQAIDQSFKSVPLAITQDGHNAVCQAHKAEKCDICNVDFLVTNRLARLLASQPNLLCPPPSNVVTPKLTQVVTSTKEEGNTLFKAGHTGPALTKYTTAASIAASRPPWEANQWMREELSTVISNRSAAYIDQRDFAAGLADAEAVIAVRRNWSKGHFRKAKALVGLHRYNEAADAVKLGLAFEPTNAELLAFLADIERVKTKPKAPKVESTVPKSDSTPAVLVST